MFPSQPIKPLAFGGFLDSEAMLNLWALLCCLMASGVFANVVLMGNNVTLSFDSIEANFGRRVKESGERGTLFLATPLDACSPLANNSIDHSLNPPYLLIIRGGCGFENKVRRAQSAGYKAAIIYNNDDSNLVSMAGDPSGIYINAVFVSRASGLKLEKYAGLSEMEVWLVRSYENSAWSIMVISFLSLLALAGILAGCFFARRHRIRRDPRTSRVRPFHGMSGRLVRALPSLVFTTVLEDNCTSETCAICLEDYNVGDKLRILPCHHKFHTICVDAWLRSWRTFCPVCKRDARTISGNPPPSERTPLLSSSPASAASSFLLSSVGSPSRAIQIDRVSPSVSYIRSISNTPLNHSSFQSSVDMRNASSSHRSSASHLISRNSLGHPSFSPLSSRYMYQSPGNSLQHSESAASFSSYASGPDC